MSIRNVLLALLLGLQIVLIGYFYKPGEKSTLETVRFFDLSPSAVSSLRLADGQGESVTLSKENGTWLIAPPENYPANSDRIGSVLEKLTSLASSQLVSSSKGSFSRLKVAEQNYNRRIDLKGADDATHTLFLGTDQGSSGTHVRRADMDMVYFVPGLSSWEFGTDPRSWWRSLLVDIPADDLTGLQLVGAHTLNLLKNETGVWTDTDGTPLDQEKVTDLIDTARSITLSEYLPKDSDNKIEENALTLTLTGKNGETTNIVFGPKRESNDHLARRDKENHLTVINNANIEALFSTTLDELQAGDTQEKERTK